MADSPFVVGWKTGFKTPASFRDIPFYVQGYDGTFGRRSVEHEFPLVDTPISQDLGKQKRVFKIDGYVLGNDYLIDRDKLIDACEIPGAGLFYHPYYGKFNAIAKPITIRETNTDTRICYFSFEVVVVSDEIRGPIRIIDPNSSLLSLTKRMLSTANSAFLKAYKIFNAPFVVVKNANSALTSAVSIVDKAKATISTIPDFQRQLVKAKESIQTLLFAPVSLAQTLISLTSYGTDENSINSSPKDKILEQTKIFDEYPNTFNGVVSPSNSIDTLMKQVSIISACNLSITIPYSSYDEAVSVRDLIVHRINVLTEEIGIDDELYSQFQDLRESVVRVINDLGSDLAQLVEITLPVSKPALVLSNDLYGTTEQEQDIIQRNNIEHSGFIPAGKIIEVIVNV